MSTEERACALDETRYRASADESRSLTVIREGCAPAALVLRSRRGDRPPLLALDHNDVEV
jgi:hypothetical protein